MNSLLQEDVASGPKKSTTGLQDLKIQSGIRPEGHSFTKTPHRISLSEFAEEFQCAIRERDALDSRLRAALEEIKMLTRLGEQARAEFEGERTRLSSELAALRQQLAASSDAGTNSPGRGMSSVMAAREKVIREEFERKFLELTVEVRQQRNKYAQAVERIKNQRSNCICQPVDLC